MASTALQIVNRVLRNLAQSSVAEFSEANRSQLVLDHVNDSARLILLSEDWDFLNRHDGVIHLFPSGSANYTQISQLPSSTDVDVRTASILTTTNLETTLIPVETNFFQKSVAHIVVTDDTVWPNTAFRVVKIDDVSTTSLIQLESGWHASVTPSPAGSGTLDYHFLEYAIRLKPSSTLRSGDIASIYSMRYQEDDISLTFLDPSESFDRHIAQAHRNSGHPRAAAIGGLTLPPDEGFQNPTLETTNAERALRVVFDRSPDAHYHVNFSYRVHLPPLAAVTDTFEATPEYIIDRIVQAATASTMAQIPNSDLQLAAYNARGAEVSIEALHRAQRPDAGRRFPLRSLDSMGKGRRRHKREWASTTFDTDVIS